MVQSHVDKLEKLCSTIDAFNIMIQSHDKSSLLLRLLSWENLNPSVEKSNTTQLIKIPDAEQAMRDAEHEL